MSNQYSMKIYPAGRGREVYRNIEICGSSTLNQLCQVILESFDFIDEHLYEFCMDNRMYSEHAYQSDPEGDEPSADITLDEVGLCKGQKFALHYDCGDDWMFTITVSKISEVQEDFEPRVIKSKELFNSTRIGMKRTLTKNNAVFVQGYRREFLIFKGN